MDWSCSSAKSAATFLCGCGLLVAAAVALSASFSAQAQDLLKLAVGAPNNWENQPAALGQEAGFFKKHGLVLDLLFTQGSGETMQAVIAGSVDIGTGVGTYGAMGAFSKGAPVRAIGNATTGAHDLYWYVRADSPIRSIKDAAGQDHRLFHHRLLDQRHRARADQGIGCRRSSRPPPAVPATH